jgi:hypothetical protein
LGCFALPAVTIIRYGAAKSMKRKGTQQQLRGCRRQVPCDQIKIKKTRPLDDNGEPAWLVHHYL